MVHSSVSVSGDFAVRKRAVSTFSAANLGGAARSQERHSESVDDPVAPLLSAGGSGPRREARESGKGVGDEARLQRGFRFLETTATRQRSCPTRGKKGLNGLGTCVLMSRILCGPAWDLRSGSLSETRGTTPSAAGYLWPLGELSASRAACGGRMLTRLSKSLQTAVEIFHAWMCTLVCLCRHMHSYMCGRCSSVSCRSPCIPGRSPGAACARLFLRVVRSVFLRVCFCRSVHACGVALGWCPRFSVCSSVLPRYAGAGHARASLSIRRRGPRERDPALEIVYTHARAHNVVEVGYPDISVSAEDGRRIGHS